MPYYHYTTLNAFKSILDSNLRMSKTNKVRSDGNEANVIQDMFKQLIFNDEALFENLASSLNVEPHIETITKQINRYRNNSYILCLSKNLSNDHLWEKFADNGKGVVIQIHDDFLPDESRSISGRLGRIHLRDPSVNLSEMLYGMGALKDYLKSILDQGKPVEPSLYILMDLIKEETHKPEEETRLLYYPGEGLRNERTINRYETRSEIEIIPAQEVDYLNITYAKNEHDPLKDKFETIKSFAAFICKKESTKTEIIEFFKEKSKYTQIEGNDPFIIRLI